MEIPIDFRPVDATADWPESINAHETEFLSTLKTKRQPNPQPQIWWALYQRAVWEKVPHYVVAITCSQREDGVVCYGVYDAVGLRSRDDYSPQGFPDPYYGYQVQKIYYVSIRCFSVNKIGQASPNRNDFRLRPFLASTPLTVNPSLTPEDMLEGALQGVRFTHHDKERTSPYTTQFQYGVALNLLHNPRCIHNEELYNRFREEGIIWLICASNGSFPYPDAKALYQHLTHNQTAFTFSYPYFE